MLLGCLSLKGMAMRLDEYQQEARKTQTNCGGSSQLLIAGVLGLCGESGEVADIVKKWLFHHKMDRPLDKDKLSDELGDVLWYICMTCDALGLDLSEIAAHNIAKLRARHGESGFKTKYHSDSMECA